MNMSTFSLTAFVQRPTKYNTHSEIKSNRYKRKNPQLSKTEGFVIGERGAPS